MNKFIQSLIDAAETATDSTSTDTGTTIDKKALAIAGGVIAGGLALYGLVKMIGKNKSPAEQVAEAPAEQVIAVAPAPAQAGTVQ